MKITKPSQIAALQRRVVAADIKGRDLRKQSGTRNMIRAAAARLK